MTSFYDTDTGKPRRPFLADALPLENTDQKNAFYINRIKLIIIVFSIIITFYFTICIISYFNQNNILFMISIVVLLSVIAILISLVMTIRKLIILQLSEAKKNTDIKNEFLANMSHEIRTPLNGITGMLHLLYDTTLSPDQENYMNTILESSNALLSLINDVLDLSKIEAGKLDIDNRYFNLALLVKGVCSLFEVQAAKKQIDFACVIDGNTPVHLMGDPGRIRQILNNLLGNAIKFTDVGEVTLTVSQVSTNTDTVDILFSVNDTGPGIPKDKTEIIFNAFTQADISVSKNYGGTGLGLKISKQLVQIMNGRIGVDSEECIGTCFWFQLPLALGEPAVYEKKPLPPTGQCQYLILGTTLTACQAIEEKLGYLNLPAKSVCDIASAIDALTSAAKSNKPFPAIIVDLNHDGPNVEDLVERLDKTPIIQSTKRILVTSIGRKGDAKYFESLGFSAFLSKPFDAALLSDCLDQVKANPIGICPIITRFSIIESRKDKAKILLVEDNQTNRVVATGLLSRLGFNPDIACDGLEALDLYGKTQYDIILLDCQLPGMDGFEVTQTIRQKEAGKRQTPIIALTADAFAGNKERCLKAGMDDFIPKPIDPDRLGDVLSQYLPNMIIQNKQRPKQQTETAFHTTAPAVFDHNTMLNTYGGDTMMVATILTDFIDETDTLISELKADISPLNLRAIRFKAHSLKGSSGNIHADLMASHARDLEILSQQNDVFAEALTAAINKLEKTYRQTVEEIRKIIYT